MIKILVVDDSEYVATAAKTYLEHHNYNVIIAVDGVQALELVQKERPNLILLDLMLPKMDGLSVLKRLKANEQTADIPVVVLSAKADSETILLAEKLGACDYLIKPSNPNTFLETVKEHLQR